MSAEIFKSLRLLEKERGISMDFMLEKINKAIVAACKNNYDGNEEVIVSIDEEKSLFKVDNDIISFGLCYIILKILSKIPYSKYIVGC